MADRLIIFEDAKYGDFYPLTLSRPVFALRCGIYPLWEKLTRRFVGYEPVLSCRPELAALLGAETGYDVNQFDYTPGDRLIFINGRLRLGDKLTKELKAADGNRIYHQDNITVAIVITEPLRKNPLAGVTFHGENVSETLGIETDLIAGEFEFYDFLWDLIDRNEDEIKRDFPAFIDNVDFSRKFKDGCVDSSARVLSDKNIHIAQGAEIGAGVVIDNRLGPVIIDRDAIVGPLSFIEGPSYIGPGTRIFRGHIRRGCSFGPCCRVGGEVEESIFQDYTNKYHDGFLGHAYLGSWVNLGAMTTNSDLKNNYSNITVQVNGRDVDTGLMKVGSFIGDHTKTGIGTLINTGVSIGFSCNIFGGTLITSREVPSFSWGDEKGYAVYRLEKAVEVARLSMSRREVPFTPDHQRLFEMIFKLTTRGR